MNAISTVNQMPVSVSNDSFFSSIQRFEETMKMSDYLARSSIVPTTFQNKPANVMIALGMAQRMKADPFMVMQNIYIVHEKPSFSSQFLIACFNSSGRFSSLQYEFEGTEGQNNWGCRAVAIELSTGERVHGPLVTIQTAINEGWMNKNGSKWKTMPELMLTYRAAAFFIRTKAPEISMGMHTAEEQHDMGPAHVVYDNETSDQSTASRDLMDAVKMASEKKANQAEKPVVEKGPETQKQADPEPKIDYVKFTKRSIDECSTIEELKVCGNDIAELGDKVTEFERKDIRAYYKAAMDKI
jgi:hypothetical protein